MKWTSWVWCAALLCSASCGGDSDPKPLSREELLDPQTCKQCHENHYNEWSGSMHAYASRDPVFLAMNKRGQEEANLGKFCVNCHAPMAVIEDAIPDFGDLSQLPDHLQGVTCYFCHNAVGVGEPHNNGNVQIANDNIMRAALGNPVDPGVHRVLQGSSPFHDSRDPKSSTLCGTCHDIVTPNGTHLERTFKEWQESIFASSDPTVFQSCQSCHMRRSRNAMPAAPGFEGSLARDTHSHLWPAVDVALTDFPNQAAMLSAVERCELQQRSISYFDMTEGTPTSPWSPGLPYTFQVQFEANAGHAMPSGAANDRRMWLEVIAYDNDVERWRSGVIAEGELEEKPKDDPAYDDQLCMLRARFK
ncbi:MAG TPA: multiheme c-type cytochrome, partial [Polyangiales bacterium]|nr:multiheme c-type cytochrome [Polyangiales bacterium]